MEICRMGTQTCAFIGVFELQKYRNLVLSYLHYE